jgi:glycosyltransferase involved in cell wall biosynthesis
VLAFCERKPEIHVKMGRFSYERVLERFSWPAVTQGFLKLFASIKA